MPLSESDLDYLRSHTSAAMITVAPSGVAKVARVGVVVVDGRIWSSGKQDRLRTKRLRRDPRCTLFVFETDGFGYRAFETNVTILEGPDTPALSLALFREMQHKPEGPLTWYGEELDEAAFMEAIASEGRLIYEFDVQRSYGPVAA